MIRSIRHILAAILIVCAAGTAAGIARAATRDTTPACWKVLINDWYDGRIDGIYPIHCYRDALKHLPSDVDTYSSARDDIQQALQKRITQNHNGNTSTTTTGGSGPSSSGPNTPGGSGPSGPNTSPGNESANGPINDAINAGKPGSADSLPVPLLVLGGVALALMAAGAAGFLARRTRLRKLQLASAAAHPDQPAGSPPKQP